MKRIMMTFNAEASVKPAEYGYAGENVGLSAVTAASLQATCGATCGIVCGNYMCRINCPVGKAAYCYCSHFRAICRCGK